jgi:hypothetical protein
VPKKRKYSHPYVPDQEVAPSKKPMGLRPRWQATHDTQKDSILTSSSLKPSRASKSCKSSGGQPATSANVAGLQVKYGGFVSESESDVSTNQIVNKDARPKISVGNQHMAVGKPMSQKKQNKSWTVEQVCRHSKYLATLL